METSSHLCGESPRCRRRAAQGLGPRTYRRAREQRFPCVPRCAPQREASNAKQHRPGSGRFDAAIAALTDALACLDLGLEIPLAFERVRYETTILGLLQERAH